MDGVFLFGSRLRRLAWPGRPRGRRFGGSDRLSESERSRVEETLFSDGPGELRPYVYRLATLTAFSTLIATFGLLENSSAVVIGAMLVSPLMQPIIGLAAALVGVEVRRQLVSLTLILFAALESVGLAALVAWIVPTFQVVTITPEILLRTSPGILDLGIALVAGAAGAYVTVRGKAAAALPGAAIAVALMPPLAALGILLQRGNSHLASGAFLLFATNLFGIILASAAVLSFTSLAIHRTLSRRGRLAILVPLLIAIAVAYPLARRTLTSYEAAKDESIAHSVLFPPLRAQGLGIQDINLVRSPAGTVVSVDVTGPSPATGENELSLALARRLHRQVSLILRWTKRTETTALVGTP